ncbi:MAG TPA: agmatinase [archaeon]|nr:agmatinase [archaeon]
MAPESGPTDLSSSKAVILPAPFERSTSYAQGTKEGPRAIIAASCQVEEYDLRLGKETTRAGIHTARAVEDDPALSPEDYLDLLQGEVGRYLDQGKLVVTLGGEHTISIAPWRAHQKCFPSLGILQLDAHADLRESYEGNPYSHASVMRRILESGPYAAVAVGIRSLCPEEAKLYAKGEVALVDAETIAQSPSWIDRALDPLPENVYLTIDADVFDPSVVPAVGTPEPGGLTWRQMLDLLDCLTRNRRVVGFDLVELSPVKGLFFPDFTCARLVYHLLGMILEA